MVRVGQVRELDKLGNDAADEAADIGRQRVDHAVIDACRNLSGVHRFFVAISRAVVHHDDLEGTVLDPLVWSAGAPPKRRKLVHAVLNQLFIWTWDWVGLPPAVIAAEDVVAWPCSVGLLIKCVAFLDTLHWPAAGADLGVGGSVLF